MAFMTRFKITCWSWTAAANARQHRAELSSNVDAVLLNFKPRQVENHQYDRVHIDRTFGAGVLLEHSADAIHDVAGVTDGTDHPFERGLRFLQVGALRVEEA